MTLLSGNKKCTTSSIYSLYSGYSYLFEGPLLRDCQDFILPSNKYSYYIPMKYESAIESVSLYGSRFKMMSPLHTCHFWYTDHLVYCSVSGKGRVPKLSPNISLFKFTYIHIPI